MAATTETLIPDRLSRVPRADLPASPNHPRKYLYAVASTNAPRHPARLSDTIRATETSITEITPASGYPEKRSSRFGNGQSGDLQIIRAARF